MTVYSLAKPFKATNEQIEEARHLMKDLSFTRTYSCNDGYESWQRTDENLDAFVELISRVRSAATND